LNGGIAPFVNLIHHPEDEFERPMSLTNLKRLAFPTFCAALLHCATIQAQTGNTGGSSGGTGSGQSGLGSGPAAGVPSAGGGTFTGNPDANPYAKESILTGPAPTSTTTATGQKSRKHASKTSKSTSRKTRKKAYSSPAASAPPAASPSRQR
jgi:hypothetical protein